MTNITFVISPPGPPSGPSLLALFPVAFGVGPGLSTLPHSLLHSSLPYHLRCISMSTSATWRSIPACLRMPVTLMLSSVVHPDADSPWVSPGGRTLTRADPLHRLSASPGGNGLPLFWPTLAQGCPQKRCLDGWCYSSVLPQSPPFPEMGGYSQALGMQDGFTCRPQLYLTSRSSLCR